MKKKKPKNQKMPNYNDWDYIVYPSKAEFPIPGAPLTVYLDFAANIDWIWDSSISSYQQIDPSQRPNKPPRVP